MRVAKARGFGRAGGDDDASRETGVGGAPCEELLHSKERTLLPGKRWAGTEPFLTEACQSEFQPPLSSCRLPRRLLRVLSQVRWE